jgi:hypothetical protein
MKSSARNYLGFNLDSKGNIYFDPTEEEIRQKKLLALKDAEFERMNKSTRAERRKFYREHMKKQKVKW